MTVSELERHLLDSIPLARAMQLRLLGLEDGRLRLEAPLAANRNDKGCAFGGSLASLMTLAGWSCTVLALGTQHGNAEIYVQDSQIRYLAPVWETIQVYAWLEDEAGGHPFTSVFAARGRARVNAAAECRLADGTIAASMVSRFVAIDPTRREAAAQGVESTATA